VNYQDSKPTIKKALATFMIFDPVGLNNRIVGMCIENTSPYPARQHESKTKILIQ